MTVKKDPRFDYIPWRVLGDTYKGIKWRCEKPQDKSYNRYGAKGIKCLFENRRDFDDYVSSLPGWKKGMQLDRINPTGNYEKGNVRWVTPKQNNANKISKTGLRHGVIHSKNKKKFISAITFKLPGMGKSKRVYLGTYKTEYEAHETYVFAHVMLHGEEVFKLSNYIKD